MNKKHQLQVLHLSQVIDLLPNSGRLVESGTWQGNDDYQDQKMFVERNLRVLFDIENLQLDKIGADLPWAEDHFQERVGGEPTNPGEAYKTWPYAKQTEEYMDDKVFSHTYQERFWPKLANPEEKGYYVHEGIRYKVGDLQDVINQLRENPLTRQAYLPIFFPEDTGAVHKQRVPCTLGYYFWVEDNKLHCNYMIRSCDALRHFRNDVYLTSRLLIYVANELDLSYGKLHFFCFNLHVFQNDVYALRKKENKLWKELIG